MGHPGWLSFSGDARAMFLPYLVSEKRTMKGRAWVVFQNEPAVGIPLGTHFVAGHMASRHVWFSYGAQEEKKPRSENRKTDSEKPSDLPRRNRLCEAKVDGSLEPRSSRPAWATWQYPISTKNTKIGWAWWHMPVVPATREAEAGELLEPRRWRLQ